LVNRRPNWTGVYIRDGPSARDAHLSIRHCVKMPMGSSVCFTCCCLFFSLPVIQDVRDGTLPQGPDQGKQYAANPRWSDITHHDTSMRTDVLVRRPPQRSRNDQIPDAWTIEDLHAVTIPHVCERANATVQNRMCVRGCACTQSTCCRQDKICWLYASTG
jgi:hypothetical protein